MSDQWHKDQELADTHAGLGTGVHLSTSGQQDGGAFGTATTKQKTSMADISNGIVNEIQNHSREQQFQKSIPSLVDLLEQARAFTEHARSIMLRDFPQFPRLSPNRSFKCLSNGALAIVAPSMTHDHFWCVILKDSAIAKSKRPIASVYVPYFLEVAGFDVNQGVRWIEEPCGPFTKCPRPRKRRAPKAEDERLSVLQ